MSGLSEPFDKPPAIYLVKLDRRRTVRLGKTENRSVGTKNSKYAKGRNDV
jgi:hypothetical protein